MYTIVLIGSRGITAEFLHVSDQPPKSRVQTGRFQRARRAASILTRVLLDSVHRTPLQSRWQVNGSDHAARAAAAKLDRREFKRDKPRIVAQTFALVIG